MKMESMKRRLAWAAVGAQCLAGSAVAQGNSGLVLEEVIVTATKRQESLMDVGVSVIAVDSAQLGQQARRGLEDIGELVPNVTIEREGGANSQRLAVRGVSSPPLDDVESSVAVFIDGVYNPSARSAFVPLYDMQRVEVLRGPQGALFGKNSIAGVLNMVTAKPTQEFEALVDLRAGNRNSHEAMVAVSGGIVEGLSARLSAFNRRTGNWLENEIGPDAGGKDSEAYRLGLQWDPTDRTQVGLKLEHFNDVYNSGTQQLISVDPQDALFFGPVNSRLSFTMVEDTRSRFGADFNRDPEQTLTSSSDLLALNVEHGLGSGHQISAVYGFSSFDLTAQGDTQNTPFLGIYLNSTTTFETHNLELRFASPRDQRLSYVVGAYFEDSEVDRRSGESQLNFEMLGPILNTVAAGAGVPGALQPSLSALAPALQFVQPADYLAQKDSIAVFAEGTFEFSSSWSLTAGLRYAKDELEVQKSFDVFDANGFVFLSPESFAAAVPVPGMGVEQAYAAIGQGIFSTFMALPGTPRERLEREDEVVLPSGKLEFRPNDRHLYYLSAQTGYKNGGFNSSTLLNSTEYEEENSLSFELGGKYTLFGGRGRLNVALFYTEFDDLQVAVVDPASGAVTFTNAAEATSQGLEVDMQWRLTDGLTVGGAYGYLDAEYDSFENAGCSVNQRTPLPAGAPCVQDLSGASVTYAPEHSASLGLDYTRPLFGSLEFQGNLSFAYSDEHFTDQPNSEQLKADSATLVHARLALHDAERDWTLALIGRNITDERGQVQGQVGSNLGTRTLFGAIRPPASYWLALEKRFH